MPPATPGRRRNVAEKPYIMFNHHPKEIGTRTGTTMPQNVPLNNDGFEDPDEFFKSPVTEPVRSLIAGLRTPRGSSRRNGGEGSSPSVGPASSTRSRGTGRLSLLDTEDDLAEEMAADLLVDDEDLDIGRLKTPPTHYFGSPNPPPSVSLPRRSQILPDSPSTGFNSIPSPRRTPRRSALSSARKSTTSPALATISAKATSTSSSRLKESLQLSPTLMSSMSDLNDNMQLSPSFMAPPSLDFGPELDANMRLLLPDEMREHEPQYDDDLRPEPPLRKQVSEPQRELDQEREDEEGQGQNSFSSRRKEDRTRSITVEDEGGKNVDIDIDAGDQGQGQSDDGGHFEGYGVSDDDNAALGEAAVDEEGDVDRNDNEETPPPPPPPVKRGRGRPRKNAAINRASVVRAGTSEPPQAKRSRVSQLPKDLGDNAYSGDFQTRRSGRQHFRPLQWWRGEHFEYTRGQNQAVITEVVHIPAQPAVPFAVARRNRARSGRSASVAIRSERNAASAAPSFAYDESEDEVGWDDNTNPIALVHEYQTGHEVRRRVAFPQILLDPKTVKGANFKYQKVFGEDKFIASGVVHIPVGGSKPAKLSRDNAYVFHVVSGAVRVEVHKTSFVISKGGQFLIPRGNAYKIENVHGKKEAELFFAQARKIQAEEDEDAEDDNVRDDNDRERGTSQGHQQIVVAGKYGASTIAEESGEDDSSSSDEDEAPPPIPRRRRVNAR